MKARAVGRRKGNCQRMAGCEVGTERRMKENQVCDTHL